MILTKPRKTVLDGETNSPTISDSLNLSYNVDAKDKQLSFIPVVQKIHSYTKPSINRCEVFFRPKGLRTEVFYQELSDEESCFIAKKQLKWLITFVDVKSRNKDLLVDELFVNVDPVALSSVVADIISLRDVLAVRDVKLVIEITERKPEALNVGLIKEIHEYGVFFALDDYCFNHDVRHGLLTTDCISYIKADVSSIRELINPIVELRKYSNQSLIIERVESVNDIDICLQIKSEGIQGFYLSRSVGIESIYVN
ncbi:EAL domain-containing protein [Photobacterium sanguinicancri]|uniref:EAL domain-containing protein n=1 Tax=Photobacterium sanguinicancri TaxID=875932 RepID=A0ABX4FT02_9GAMM|nr:EAL domain-containing protein [Photobacterium sanguinicancri]OZS42026.1 hypothetical protein ASV53_20600 [Photobacterium sanguinicancri]